MDFVASLNDTAIHVILEPTINAFAPLLEKNRAQIESIKKKTFKYGTTDRHQLDVYYPPTLDTTASKPPILFFFYGGGLTSGARSFPPPRDLVYACVGSFFAARGILTVIADYRLVPHVRYPEPAEDVRDAVLYVVQNVTEGDTNRLFFLGHSAGAIHCATFLLHQPSLLESTTLQPRIKGVVLNGGMFQFNDPPAPLHSVLTAYYGTDAHIRAHAPSGLLDAAPSDVVTGLPPVLMCMGEHEPQAVVTSNDAFAALLEKKSDRKIERFISRGHNHISPHPALGSGEGEEWGEDVAAWIKK